MTRIFRITRLTRIYRITGLYQDKREDGRGEGWKREDGRVEEEGKGGRGEGWKIRKKAVLFSTAFPCGRLVD